MDPTAAKVHVDPAAARVWRPCLVCLVCHNSRHIGIPITGGASRTNSTHCTTRTQAVPCRTVDALAMPAVQRPVHTPRPVNYSSNIAPAKSGFEMCFDIGSQHVGCWGQNTPPHAQGCDLSWTVSHIIYHDRSQPWAYGIHNKKSTSLHCGVCSHCICRLQHICRRPHHVQQHGAGRHGQGLLLRTALRRPAGCTVLHHAGTGLDAVA